MDVRKTFFTERVIRLEQVAQESGEVTISKNVQKNHVNVALRDTVLQKHGGTGLMVGLNNLGGLVQA